MRGCEHVAAAPSALSLIVKAGTGQKGFKSKFRGGFSLEVEEMSVDHEWPPCDEGEVAGK